MNKILNPFEYFSSERTLGWGLLGTLFALVLLIIARSPFSCSLSSLTVIFSTNLLLWLPLSLLLYVLALFFSPSRIRALDIFATNLFALLPTMVVCGVTNLISMWLAGLGLVPGSIAEVMARAGYNLMVILLSVAMVWSMVWGCFAYSVSANMQGWRGIVIFVLCYVLVSVVTLTMVQYL